MLKTRIQKLNGALVNDTSGNIIYVMSRDQRVNDNHALLAASKHAEALGSAVIVYFNIYPKVKNRIKPQYEFMFKGLTEIVKDLNKLNISFISSVGDFNKSVLELVNKLNVSTIYFDFSPLNGPINTKKKLAEKLKIPCYVVDTHNIVPIWVTSDKEEYAARTIRPKINSKLASYLVEPELLKKQDSFKIIGLDEKFKINPDKTYFKDILQNLDIEDFDYKVKHDSGKMQLKKSLIISLMND
ncbi:MAG: deoxyribodipyrimidine photo-lyase [Candidatus Dojkabacteria bacterium]|nr:deoxyribodipyrimidine photo-lyase [Candidatus Dojkabacteria bacterium]